MIPKLHILLAVQHLQKGRGRISSVIGGHLVDLIQKHQGIGRARLAHGLRDPSRHGSHISLPVSPDLRLVMDSAQADPDIFLSQRPGHRPGDGSLSGSRRAHQAENRAGALLGQSAHRQIFQHPLLYLLQAVMILFQDLLRMGQILVVLGHLFPGQLQHRLNISPQHVGLLAAAGHGLKAHDLLSDLLLCLLVRVQLLQLFQIRIRVGTGIFFSQLLLDHLQLFPEYVVPLVLIHVGLYLRLIIPLDPQDLQLPHQIVNHPVIQKAYVVALQHFLLDRIVPGELIGGLDQKLLQIPDRQKAAHKILHGLGIGISKLLQLLPHNPAHGLLGHRAQIFFLHRRLDDLRLQVRTVFRKIDQFRTALPFHHHPDNPARHLYQLLDPGDGSDLIQTRNPRILFLRMSLGHQKNLLLPYHGAL